MKGEDKVKGGEKPSSEIEEPHPAGSRPHDAGEYAYEMPAPPRSPIISALLILACLYFVWLYRADFMYSLFSADPVDLGNAPDFQGTDLPSDSAVKVKAIPNASRILSLNSMFSSTTFFGVIGSPKVFIITRTADKEAMASFSPQPYTGRLKRVGELPFYEAVKTYAKNTFGKEPAPDAIVVLHQDLPADFKYRGLWAAYPLLLMVLVFNIVLMVIRFRAVKAYKLKQQS